VSEFFTLEVEVGKELDLFDCFKRSKILDKLLAEAMKNAESKHLKPLLVCSRKRKSSVAWKRAEDCGEMTEPRFYYRGWVGIHFDT